MDQAASAAGAVFVYVTAPDEPTAAKLAETIVRRRLAACANILSGMRSVYWWDGQLDHADEVVLIFKTRADRVDRLTKAVVEEHPYECPCVAVLPITGGNAEFLKWIAAETEGGA
jgi:periplasmic divalent cation tolerance protein